MKVSQSANDKRRLEEVRERFAQWLEGKIIMVKRGYLPFPF